MSDDIPDRPPMTVVKITRQPHDDSAPWVVTPQDRSAHFILPQNRLPLFVRRTLERKPQAYFEAVIDGAAVFYSQETHEPTW